MLSDAALARLTSQIDRPDAGPRYTVHELLGRGGMGAVYRAFDTALGRDVALKVLGTDMESPAVAARLQREARVLARLEHPGIVAVHDAGVLADGRPFYVMRLVRGTRLDQYARTAGRGELLRVFLRICEAVASAHAQEVIHRDLTPSNVMIGDFGDVLVLDWGVAKAPGEQGGAGSTPSAGGGHAGTGDGVVVGTPGFMAPEQAAGQAAHVDVRADVFGLGAILRHLLSASAAPVPRPLQAIVDRAMAAVPDGRYPSARELAADVRRWLDADTVQAYRERPWERLGRFYRRNQTLILLLLAYAVVRVVILLWRGI